jgi:CHAT domain-containing protein
MLARDNSQANICKTGRRFISLNRLIVHAVITALVITTGPGFAASPLQGQAVDPSVKAQADKVNQDAVALAEKNELPAAIGKFEHAVELYRRAHDQTGEAKALRNAGQAYFSLGVENKDRALDYLNRALSLYRSLGDHNGEGLSLANIGLVLYKTGDKRGALRAFEESLPLLPQSWMKDNEGMLRTMMGDSYLAEGERQKAIDNLQQALRYWQASNEPAQTALAANELGLIYLMSGDNRNAFEYLKQARQLWHELKNVQREAFTLQALGTLSERADDQSGAVSYYNQARSLFHTANLQREEATVLNLMGIFYSQLGDPQRGMDYHTQALRIWRELGDRKAVAGTNVSIALTYHWMGDDFSARGPLYAALDAYQALDDRDGIASALFNLGLNYEETGDHQQALAFLNRSLPLWRSLKDIVGESRTLRKISEIYTRQGDKQKAQESLAQEVALSASVTDPDFKALILSLIGLNYTWLGSYQDALGYYRQALDLFRSVSDKQGVSESLTNIGTVYEFRGDLQQALDMYLQSIQVREEIRTAARLEELQTGVAGKSAGTYQYAVSLLMQLDRPTQAFELSERARARTLLDQLGNARIDPLRGADPQLVQREQSIRAELSALERQYASENSGPSPDIAGARPQAPKSAREISSLQNQYDAVLTQLKASNPEYVSMRTVNPLTLRAVQQALDKDTTLVSYFITLDRTQAFVITQGSFKAVSLPVNEEDLEKTVRAFRGFPDVNNPNANQQNLRKLYSWLVEPLRPHLKTPLVGIVPHGILHYLPFAALTDGKRYFGEDYELFYLPSASILPFIREKRKAHSSTLLSVSQSQAEGAPVLTYADQTAAEVARLYNTTAITGPAATETALRTRISDSGIIFLAAHGRLAAANPLFSRIILASDEENDGFLEVHEVYRLDLRRANLVVLSGCQTQLGRQSRGDDIVGLNRAFIYAGSPSVVASLWSVPERQTGELMLSFFKHLKGGESKAAALSAAQAEVRKEYPNPYYWAAFVLTGDAGKL